jgi:adenine-specific DNA-methyltransferase
MKNNSFHDHDDYSLLSASIRQTVKKVVVEIGDCHENSKYVQSFSVYSDTLNNLLKPYKHHLGSSFDKKKAESRFKVETVLLRLITEVCRTNLGNNGLKGKRIFPIDRSESFFSWYDFVNQYSADVEEITTHLQKIPYPELHLSEICGDVLRDAGDSIIGEFYTPNKIVDHLISLSGATPEKILSGKRVIDPACGAGIVLLKLLSQLVTSAPNKKYPPEKIIALATENLWGFDIQPFAVEITKTLMLYSCLLSFGNRVVPQNNVFMNVRLIDTLSTDTEYWYKTPENKRKSQGFDFIIGNPPYMTVKSSDIKFLDSYSDAVSGHPNLFQLFLWWAVRAAEKNGMISFLVPQSMVSGVYYKKLRTQIQSRASLCSVTRLTHSKGVIADADIQMMALALKVKDESSKEKNVSDISIRVSRNGEDINDASPFLVSASRVIKNFNVNYPTWVIGSSLLDYDILQKIDQESELFGNSLSWSIGTGTYVWNQNKVQLLDSEKENCIPLISATSIKRFDFSFPYTGNHPSGKRQFSLLDPKLSSLIFSGPILLIQRTTPRKYGHRIVAAVPPTTFFEKYPLYFVENHVNYVLTPNHDVDLLLGLLGWMNSDLFNYVFLIRNGSNVVSINEVKYQPVKYSLLQDITPITKLIMDSTGEKRDNLLNDLNDSIFDGYKMTDVEKRRIKSVLNRKDAA